MIERIDHTSAGTKIGIHAVSVLNRYSSFKVSMDIGLSECINGLLWITDIKQNVLFPEDSLEDFIL